MYLAHRARVSLGAFAVASESYPPHIVVSARADDADQFCLLIVQSGELLAEFDGRSSRLVAGQGAFISAGAQLLITTSAGGEILTIGVARDAFEDGLIADAVVLPVLRQKSLLPAIAAFVSTVFAYPRVTGLSQHHFETLLRDMVRAVMTGEKSISGTSETVMEQALAVIWERHADRSLSPAAIADEVNLSLRHLEREFSVRQTTIRREIRRVRVEVAAVQLADPALEHYSVGQVAQRVGFSNGSSLARAMAAEAKPSPSRIRARDTSPADSDTSRAAIGALR